MATEISHELDIAAPIETVFGLLTTADGLLEWIAVDAVVEPRTGGAIRWTHENGDTVNGEIIEIDPPHRLVFTYGWVDNPSVGPGSTVVEIGLEQLEGTRTRLRLIHRGLPDDVAESHTAGWTYFLRCLAELLRSEAGQ